MWVYADREVDLCIAEEAERLAADWRLAMALPPGLERHSLLVRMLIRAGMVWQARADFEFAYRGEDEWPEREAADRALTLACAHSVCSSVESRMQQSIAPLPDHALSILMQDDRILPARIPEGFAFYDLYPEFMIAPARRLPRGEGTYVIGLRSIGTSLAAMVAAVVGSPHLASVRPIGEPFDRRLQVSAGWNATLRAADCVALVDEGPGLSGSSFAAAGRAVAEATRRDVAVFMPTHHGQPGIAAMAEDRAAWHGVRKEVADRTLFDEGPWARAAWFSDWMGPALRVTDLSGGQWRKVLGLNEIVWPACDPMQERVKWRVETQSGDYLLKFSGLTPLSDQAFEHAQMFADLGFGVKPLAERHGMMLWPWYARAVPLTRSDKPLVLPILAAMLAFRATRESAVCAGASIHHLFAMARANLSEAFGSEVTAPLERWHQNLDAMAAQSTPVRIDGRLDCHEFIRLPEGRIVKTDALDHHAAHDLIGCQDIMWDVAGAMVEWSLAPHEVDVILQHIAHVTGRAPLHDALPFYAIAYTAFRLGSATMSAEALGEVNAAEAQRFRKRVAFYTAAGQLLLAQRRNDA